MINFSQCYTDTVLRKWTQIISVKFEQPQNLIPLFYRYPFEFFMILVELDEFDKTAFPNKHLDLFFSFQPF